MFEDIPILSGAINRMGFLSARQQILSENLANVDTPKYKARDLDETRFNRLLKDGITPGVELLRAHPTHFHSKFGSSNFWAEKTDDFYESTLSGNNVNLEENLIKMNQNATDYSLATNIYSKMHGFLNIAIGR